MKDRIKTKTIEEFMKANRLSKRQFCALCQISVSTFDKIMQNDFYFYLRALFKIAKVMGLHVCDLFE